MAKIKGGETYLTRHLEHNDYYSENETVTGEWVGSGATILSLAGKLKPNDPNFEALRLNLDPLTWEPLTMRTNTTRALPDGSEVSNRVAFYDFQCSAQKSVSIMAILAGDRRLVDAHRHASELAFKHMEEYAACRMGAHRMRIPSGNMVAARFQHDSSRQLDPQLHSHFVVANATFDGSEWRALETYDIVKYVDYFGRIYQSEMALACRRLGYGVVQTEKGFEIEGISSELREKFSKRSLELEKAAASFQEKYGREPSLRERNLMARETRPDKLTEIATPEVRALQWNQLTDAEKRQLAALRRSAVEREIKIVPNEIEKALDRAKAQVFERVSVVERRQFLAAALFAGLGQADLETISKASARGDLLFRDQYVTTMEHLQAERMSIQYVRSQHEVHESLVPEITQDLSDLSAERQEAVKLVLTSKAGVMAIEGKAGVGKTTVLRRIEDELVRNHRDALFLAPTTMACQSLEQSVRGPVVTLQRFLQSEEAQTLARGRLVVVDEVSLVSTLDGARLLGLAERLGFRVLLVGDTKQMLSVQAGDWFRVLLDKADLPRARLTDIIRQKPGTLYHAIVTKLSENHVASALHLLETTSAIHEGPRYCKMAAQHYVELTSSAPGSVDLVAPTWHENYAITDEVRKLLKENGQIRESRAYEVFDSARWEIERKASARQYEPGHAVTFIRDAGAFVRGDVAYVREVSNGRVKVATASGLVGTLPLTAARSFDVGRVRTIDVGIGDTLLLRRNEHRLVNGHVSTVESIGDDGTIHLKSGMVVPPSYTAFTHGYCLTAFRSQSRTAQHVIVASTNMDARSFYTALSRGRVGCDLFTPDFKLFKEQMTESLARPSATDLIRDVPTRDERLRAVQAHFQEYLRKLDDLMKEPAQSLIHKVHALADETRESWSRPAPPAERESFWTAQQARLTSHHYERATI